VRVELANIVHSGAPKGKAGTGALADSLKEGDVIRAQVISNVKGIVTLKTDDAQIFKARPDTGNVFSPGDKVLLELTAKENDTLFLSIREDTDESTAQTAKPGVTSGFEDKSLGPYAAKLAELKMPVSEESARSMRELMSQYPRISLDEAAFLASNKLAGNEDLIKAALAMMSDGEKTDVMLGRIIAMLELADSLALVNILKLGTKFPPGQGPEPVNQLIAEAAGAGAGADAGVGTPAGEAATGNQSLPSVEPAPLMDWFAHLSNSTQGSLSTAERINQASIPGTTPIIAHTDTNLQSRNEISNELFINNDEILTQKPDLPTINERIMDALNNNKQPSAPSAPPLPASTGTPDSILSSQLSPPAAEASAPQASQVSPVNSQLPVTDSSQLSSLNTQLSALLAELPEFRHTPPEILERFSNTLLRVAGESADITHGDTDKLKILLDKLFTRIERSDNDAGERLRNAREELFTRLSFIEEATMRASPAAKTEMLEQTQRLMQHVRLLNNIDQFVYMQLPVAF